MSRVWLLVVGCGCGCGFWFCAYCMKVGFWVWFGCCVVVYCIVSVLCG